MKNIFDYKHVKSVSIGLLLNQKTNEIEGKIISNWSDNPNGSVCTTQAIIYKPEKFGLVAKRYHYKDAFLDTELDKLALSRARGYGYDKLSSAIESALEAGFVEPFKGKESIGGRGESAVRGYFESLGLRYESII